MKTKTVRDRLKEKNGHGLLINHLRTRYAFSPAMAEVLAEDARYLSCLTVAGNREDGQIVWHAVKSTEPAGKRLKDCEYLAVTLTLHDPEDVVYRHQHGLVALKRRILKRVSDEAVAHGGALTQEDLAAILCMDRSTVASHITALARQGQTVITRAHFTDAGRTVTHKRPIVRQFLLNVPETEIARRTGHNLSSVENYIDGFLRVTLSHRKGDTLQLISRITGFSLFLVQEYVALYKELAADETFAVPLRKVLDFYADGLLSRQAKKGG